MKRLVAMTLFVAAATVLWAACGPGGNTCGADTDCKGDRVCNDGECVFPDDGSNSGSQNNPSNSDENSASNASTTLSCPEECAAKFDECSFQPPQGSVEENCAFLCSQISDDEVQCLADSTCEELEQLAVSGADSVCPEGGTNSNTNSSSNADTNSNSGPDSDEGGSCMCDEHPETMDESIYGYCEGTEDGCKYDLFSDEPQLGCFYVYKTGEGTCHYPCSKDDLGSQGDCPDGYICADSGLPGLTGETFAYCE